MTYLLGAGASFGERGTNRDGKKTFVRGLPVINEIQEAVAYLTRGIDITNPLSIKMATKDLNVDAQGYVNLISKLRIFQEMCASFPTIDTLAKQLFVTNRPFISKNGNKVNYEELKTLLSVALLMLQNEDTRDLRYDGFIASLIDKNRNFPPMTILSWNYDAQFELAYSGYYAREKYIPTLWGELNVLNKTYPTKFDINRPFAMIKLNGTAFFTDMRYPTEINGTSVPGLRDCFYGGDEYNKYQYGAEYLSKSVYHNTLSYAWEDDHYSSIRNAAIQRTEDTEELIVIGYSFPYVNNEMDSLIIQQMRHLNKIVIQDKNFEDIKERIEGILAPTGRNIEMVSKKNLQQFYIPNKFER